MKLSARCHASTKATSTQFSKLTPPHLVSKLARKHGIDKQARFDCKGNTKFWYDYKEHVNVDIQSGLINKIASTPANLTDAQGFKHTKPGQGAVYQGKGYFTAAILICPKATTTEPHPNITAKDLFFCEPNPRGFIYAFLTQHSPLNSLITSKISH